MKRFAPALIALSALLPMAAHAHDAFIVPSATVLSGEKAWVTVDAAIGNDKFYFNHAPMRLDGLEITGPDGQTVQAENQHTGKLRSGFDAQLTKDGTYRIAVVTDGTLLARWKENGANKRWFGTAKDLASKVPQNAEDLTVIERVSRVETFVTKGQPTDIQPVTRGFGIQMEPHPNDLFAQEEATFTLTLDGQPAADTEVHIVPGGSRYRDSLNEIKVTTDKQGRFSVTWPQAGAYWLHASGSDGKTSVEQASKRAVSYSLTLEVLPQ